MTEKQEQIQLCHWIKLQYPKVRFNSDMSGEFIGGHAQKGNGKTAYKHWNQLKKVKLMRSDDGFPDLFISEARHGYCGLYIELKKTGTALYLKNGQMSKAYREGGSKYNQVEWLNHFNSIGYKAVFAVGIKEAKEIIKKYLG